MASRASAGKAMNRMMNRAALVLAGVRRRRAGGRGGPLGRRGWPWPSTRCGGAGARSCWWSTRSTSRLRAACCRSSPMSREGRFAAVPAVAAQAQSEPGIAGQDAGPGAGVAAAVRPDGHRRNQRFMAGELVREQLMRQLGEELPYATTSRSRVRGAEPKAGWWSTRWSGSSANGQSDRDRQGRRAPARDRQPRAAMEQMFDARCSCRPWSARARGWNDNETALRALRLPRRACAPRRGGVRAAHAGPGADQPCWWKC